ncbi:MAG: IS1595 family transposase [Rhodospirillales bacterium CG15_BIG_FIL_POST_REV_8_21_14_020_66_15]|nr:MAG: IS1595 family transposase [Rhodospirillales bacterium CG15_BIG_FIL_POST_REV_8_21_14_020_66_15]
MADTEKFTVRDFFNRFPNDDACLEHVMEVRFGLRHVCRACGMESTFHRLANRKAYTCARCGDHLYPCAGTVFEDSRTSLQMWFYAIFLFVTTRHGVSGKELERQLGVTYKTAWRMGQQIRKLMAKADGFEVLRGHIELDEAYVGGKRSGGKRGRGAEGKTIVFGMKEREGRMTTEIIPNVKKVTLRDATLRNVEAGSTVSTDELMSYGLLDDDGYKHGMVKHGAKEWSYYDYRHDAFHHVNHVESFWKLFKASIRSTHIHVSAKYMDRYLKEFTFRSNHREKQNAMFDLLVGAV